MKIKIVQHKQDNFNHLMEVRYEQETLIQNSVNCNVLLKKSETSHLTDDEIKTLAFKKKLSEAVRVFKGVEYQEEDFNPIDFEIVPSKPHKFELISSKIKFKEKGKTYNENIVVQVLDQYGEHLCDAAISMNDIEGASLIESDLSITSDTVTQVQIKASYGDLTETIIIQVNQFEKEPDPNEMLAGQVTNLMFDNIENKEKLEMIAGQITNLMLGGM